MAAKFKIGDRVQVRMHSPSEGWQPPAYIRGKIGSIEAIREPEPVTDAGEDMPKQFLYLTRFDQTHVWENYQGSPQDKLFNDIYEHWLEPA